LLVGVFFKKTENAVLIYDAHEFFAYQASWFKGLVQKLFLIYEKHLIAYADHCFMVSAPLAAAMKDEYGLERDFHIVPNVFTSKLAVEKMTVVPQKPVAFHYMGGFLEERGLQFLVENWVKIDPALAVLHLRGHRNNHFNFCESRARDLGLLNRSVFFHPPVREEALVATASQYDVGVIPYLPVNLNNSLCCPNKLAQYMSAGNAILTNALPNVESFIKKYKCGVVYDTLKPESFLAAINALCNEPILISLKEHSLRAVVEDYNWEVQGQPFIDVYGALSSH
jgi:glycosyltransferase involved in cell wall biosynthesis